MSILRPNNTGSLITVFMTKPPMAKSKLDHLKDMLQHSIEHKQIKFKYVLMDTWYATKDIMLYIDNLQKIYYCPF